MKKRNVKYEACVALDAISEARKMRETDLDNFYKTKRFLDELGVIAKIEYCNESGLLIMKARLTESESYALRCFEKREFDCVLTFEHFF